MKEPLSWRQMREWIHLERTREYTLTTLRNRFGADAIAGLAAVVETIDNATFLTTLYWLAITCSVVDEFKAKLSSLPNPNMSSR
jgi:hypothetical protein